MYIFYYYNTCLIKEIKYIKQLNFNTHFRILSLNFPHLFQAFSLLKTIFIERIVDFKSIIIGHILQKKEGFAEKGYGIITIVWIKSIHVHL